MFMDIFFQVSGWIGTFLVVLAYFLVETKKNEAKSKSYQFLNLFGAIGVGMNVFYYHAWPSFTLQIIWAVIALFSLVKIATKKK